jgi:hypothetical protein
MDDFEWSWRESIGCMSQSSLIFMCWGLWKIQLILSHSCAIIQVNINWQNTPTIACKLSLLIWMHPMDDFGWSWRESMGCIVSKQSDFYVLMVVENSAHHIPFLRHIQVTNWQNTPTIACKPSLLILMHPMYDFEWSWRESIGCMSQSSLILCAERWVVENSAHHIPFSGHNPGHQLTKHPNHSL